MQREHKNGGLIIVGGKADDTAASAGYAFRLLAHGEVFRADDEFLADGCIDWLPVGPLIAGATHDKRYRPTRRKL